MKEKEKNNKRDKNKENDQQITNNNNKPSEQLSLHSTENDNENKSTTVDQPTPQTPRAAVTNIPTLPAKATDRSAKNENIKIITQNVQGLRSEEKIEYIIRLMKKKTSKPILSKEHT